jgi:Ni/Co efflux regulator RcnB
MKKVLLLVVILLGLSGSVLMAQDGNFDPAKMKERQLQQLKDSDLKLTDVQADSVVNINMETRQQMRGLRDLGDEERRTKMKEINDYRLKRWTAALKDEALAKRVAEYYEKMRANRPNGGGGSQ